jgi:hypothetical protein
VSAIRIAAVEFMLDDAKEFARRIRLNSTGETFGGLTPGRALAAQIDQRIYEGGGEVALTETEAGVAAAVLDEWRLEPNAPESALALYYALAPGTADQEFSK